MKKYTIQVIVVNKPTKEQASKKVAELCEFLKHNWVSKKKTKK